MAPSTPERQLEKLLRKVKKSAGVTRPDSGATTAKTAGGKRRLEELFKEELGEEGARFLESTYNTHAVSPVSGLYHALGIPLASPAGNMSGNGTSVDPSLNLNEHDSEDDRELKSIPDGSSAADDVESDDELSEDQVAASVRADPKFGDSSKRAFQKIMNMCDRTIYDAKGMGIEHMNDKELEKAGLVVKWSDDKGGFYEYPPNEGKDALLPIPGVDGHYIDPVDVIIVKGVDHKDKSGKFLRTVRRDKDGPPLHPTYVSANVPRPEVRGLLAYLQKKAEDGATQASGQDAGTDAGDDEELGGGGRAAQESD